MGLIESLQRRKSWLVPGFFGAAILLAGYSCWNVRRDTQLAGPAEQAYYSDDEGKTYFPDALDKPFPFDHNGKQAYRAFVYTCSEGGKPFVGLLGRQGKASTSQPVNSRYTVNASGTVEVKKPGGADKWVPFMSAEGQLLIQSLCPAGRPMAVLPGGGPR